MKPRPDKHKPVLAAVFLGLVLMLAPVTAWARQVHVLAIGDSIMAGYNLMESDSIPSKLEAALKTDGHDVVIQNAGVSGDTTAMGFDRLDWLLAGDKPDMAMLELGGNDVLRGLSPKHTRENLTAIIEKLQAKDIPILLLGMKSPRNMGRQYVAEFDPIFPELAQKYHLTFYPFVLDGVYDHPGLLQYDGKHPTRQGVETIVKGLLPVLEPMIARLEKTPTP